MQEKPGGEGGFLLAGGWEQTLPFFRGSGNHKIVFQCFLSWLNSRPECNAFFTIV